METVEALFRMPVVQELVRERLAHKEAVCETEIALVRERLDGLDEEILRTQWEDICIELSKNPSAQENTYDTDPIVDVFRQYMRSADAEDHPTVDLISVALFAMRVWILEPYDTCRGSVAHSLLLISQDWWQRGVAREKIDQVLGVIGMCRQTHPDSNADWVRQTVDDWYSEVVDPAATPYADYMRAKKGCLYTD